MNITTNDSDFERHNFFVNLVRIPLFWFFDFLPTSILNKLFVAFGEKTKEVFSKAKTYQALEIMYTFPERKKRGQASWFDILWDALLYNSKAVRNRLRFVKRVLKGIITQKSKEDKPVRIFSVGSGSGRSILETISSFDDEVPIEAIFFDKSQSALRFSQQLTKEIVGNGAQINFQWVCAKTEKLEDLILRFSPDIVEMVGILDYFNDSDAKGLFRLIQQCLASDGWFIVSNVRPNIEAVFVTKAVRWPLIYRTSEQLQNLLINGGFGRDKIRLFIEPLEIYTIAVCQKT